jgi:hypothetical protein
VVEEEEEEEEEEEAASLIGELCAHSRDHSATRPNHLQLLQNSNSAGFSH